MKLSALGQATDLTIERAKILQKIAAVKQGRFSMVVGDVAVQGLAKDAVGELALGMLSRQLYHIEAGLSELGIEIDELEIVPIEARPTKLTIDIDR